LILHIDRIIINELVYRIPHERFISRMLSHFKFSLMLRQPTIFFKSLQVILFI